MSGTTDLAALNSRRRHATTTSGPVSYLDVGSGRPAVFLHGIITNSILWRHVIDAVASERRRCIAIDLPGHGGTPPADEGADVSLSGLARRVVEVCDLLALDRFDLVANDTGGAVAQIVAAHLGDRLSTLTLTDCDTEGNTPPTLFKPVAAAARPTLMQVVGPRIAKRRKLARALLVAGYQHPSRLPDQVVDAYVRPVLGNPVAARAFARLVSSLASDDLATVRPQLARLRVPTLIVWGTGDPFFPVKWGRRLAGLIAGPTQFITISGARMHFPDEHADIFLSVLQRHWESHAQ